MSDTTSTIKINFNGKEQLIYDYDIIIGDEVIGRMQIFISSKLEASRWVYNEQAIKTLNNGQMENVVSWSEVYLNENTDLVTLKHKSDGSLETYLDIRE